MITDKSFNYDFCIQYKLGFGEIFILSELYTWLFSNNPPEKIIMDNTEYYYISQSYFYNLHSGICSLNTIKNYFKKFKEIGLIKDTKIIGRLRQNYISFDYSVIKDSINVNEINKTGINSEWIKHLEEKIGDLEMDDFMLLDESDFDIKPRKYSKEAEQIVIDLINGQQNVFTTRVPKDLNKPTKTFIRCCKIIQDIYNGKFTNPRLYHFSPDFEDNKQFNVEGWKNKIKSVAGDYSKIKDLLNKSVQNFKLMFDKDRMPFKKSYLQNNLDKWLFDDYTYGLTNATSQFVQSLNEPMFTRQKLSENKADRIFDTLNNIAKVGGNKLFNLNKNMASGAFWESVQKMVEWGNNLIHYDENVHCWIETASELPGLFADYLSNNNININLSTIDIEKAVECNGPWCWFLQEISSKHGLNKEITSLVTTDDFIDCYGASVSFDDMEEIPLF